METERIDEQARRIFGGEAWHGPSLDEALDGVTAEMAAARPLPGAHSIHEVALHLATWHREVARRLREGTRRDVPAAEDWPTPPAGEAGWRRTREELAASRAALRAALGGLEDGALDRPLAGRETTLYHEVHGVLQHAAYHAGQIVLLRRGLGR